MFNQPHPARAAVPWQPNAGIADKLSSRGYATTSWTSDVPEAFADLGFSTKSSGFSAAHYQPTKQPLSKQAQASLALLEGEYRNEALGEEKPASLAGSETNEHLPFVMDAYGASRKTKLRVNVDAAVLQRALAQAEMAESLVVSPITSDDKVADPIVIHPDVADAQDAQDVQALALEAQAAQAVVEAAAAEQAAAQEAQTAAEQAAAQEAQAAIEPTEPVLPAVVGGIAPEEVEQREAEQFAKGLAQAREEAALALGEAVAKATEEALAQGMAQGKAEGLTEGLLAGKEQGMAEADARVRAELAEEMAAQRVVFENASNALVDLMADPKKFFEPLKRLALHIAEQVVVGELETSSKGIERLVQRCLEELDHPVHGAVVLELNPEDKARLQSQAADFLKGMRLEAVPDLKVGSVRVFANDTVVEDLVEHRLEGLAKALLVDVDAWREKSPLAKEIVDVQQEEAEDGDVHS
ncbi:FliH/SctL family protein [Limnohabitans sp.]|uniref:FliH/SctL family protein n=1 Tax=Limnohabitans sp. TaxID=1907725 RepID=UPI00286EC442|nr:FliH/SctL family protein [Limnohabitans sp.]